MSRSLTAWFMLVVALCSWGAAGYAVWYVGGLSDTYALEKAERADAENREASATRINSLIVQTASERARLDALVGKDLVSVVELIEGVGAFSGSVVRVDDVSEMNASVDGPRPALHTLRVLASARGSFDNMMHTALLLESLPAPVLIEEFSFEHTPGEGAGEWNLLVRMQIVTSKDITS